jgi:hypothetical protein
MRLTVPLFAVLLAACTGPAPTFTSAPPAGSSRSVGSGVGLANAGAASGTQTPSASASSGSSPRTVQETDLYRLEGTRLYYLNAYRGLMVFDVTDVDHPRLLGRSAIFGSPVDMIVRNGIAVVVVGDWYGEMDNGTPFRGSIVRGLDASDPTNIKVLGEAKLGGWVRDDRVVGDVLYAVSEDYGWSYGWDVAMASSPAVIISSVSFAGGVITPVSTKRYDGYSGIFNVTPNAILLAHSAFSAVGQPATGTELRYLDISDPGGAIVEDAAIVVPGLANGWGADNGRWNLDFADGKTAHVIGCQVGFYGYCDGSSGYVLSTVDFTDPHRPALASELVVPATGWNVAARFDSGRLYLSPDTGWWVSGGTTPFQVYDLTDPKAPRLAGTVQIPGSVWNILPAPSARLFALGNNSSNSGSTVSLSYLDVTNPAAPSSLGTASFGNGWAWTPAAGTFKAFTMDAQKGLVVLPFAGWDSTAQTYVNGLQLIEFTPTSITTGGAAHTKGWVERGIFVGPRLVSLSDLSLAVIDYTDVQAPAVVTELTLARNVISAQPTGGNIAEISSDWWDNSVTSSEVRVLPIASAEETADVPSAVTLAVEGVNAQVFANGSFVYVVTSVRSDVACPGGGSGCYGRAQQVQVIDLSNGTATLRGKVRLPVDSWNWWGWGWFGCYWWDWWGGAEVVQAGGDALAFRRWEPVYSASGSYLDANSDLYVVDLSNPDAPTVASTTITSDPDGWWGNMRVVGQTLYTSHYEWLRQPAGGGSGTVAYYLDRIDLSDRAHPVVGSKLNVPGLLVGGSESDPTLLYTIDYAWDGANTTNDFNVLRVSGSRASLLSRTALPGWVGSTYVRGAHAYFSAQTYSSSTSGYSSSVQLHDLDLTDPAAPQDRVAPSAAGWGWLLDVQGDRALMTSGWGSSGLDIYQLASGQAPRFSQFVRTRGWWINGAARQGNALFLSSGYWGVQRVDLQ